MPQVRRASVARPWRKQYHPCDCLAVIGNHSMSGAVISAERLVMELRMAVSRPMVEPRTPRQVAIPRLQGLASVVMSGKN